MNVGISRVLWNCAALFDVVVLIVIFFSFSTYILITFHLTTTFIKNLSLIDLHNLSFSIWYHNMLFEFQKTLDIRSFRDILYFTCADVNVQK
jgi:hypothetical protein